MVLHVDLDTILCGCVTGTGRRYDIVAFHAVGAGQQAGDYMAHGARQMNGQVGTVGRERAGIKRKASLRT